MKIALVTPYDYPYPGGVTEHISSLDRIFRQWGHEVWVLAASSRDEDELDDNVLKVSGVVPLPSSGSVARISLSPRVYRRVKGILRDLAVDIVHLHEPMMPVLPLIVLRHSRAVNVGTFHAFRENSNPGYEYGKHLLQPFSQDGVIFDDQDRFLGHEVTSNHEIKERTKMKLKGDQQQAGQSGLLGE